MNAILETMDNLVSLSDFNKGEAGKIFDMVKKTNQVKLVLKRNEPECVLLSPETYRELMSELEDLRDYKLAVQRIEHDNGVRYSREDVIRCLDVKVADDNSEGNIELE